jgi:hypothetical protein
MKLPLPLLLAAAAVLATVAPAQEKAKSEVAAPVTPNAGDASAPVQIALQFFAALTEGEIDQAYATLTRGSQIANRPEELRLLKQKTKEAIDVFGVISGHELVENKTVGTRLIRATYVSLGKEFPLRWRFYFYKADKVWRLVDLRVDDKLTGIFEEPEEPKAGESR